MPLLRTASAAALLLLGLMPRCSGHGSIVVPTPRNRNETGAAAAGDCHDLSCMWFSQPVEIPGDPTLNDERYRTFNVKVSAGPRDWSRKMPWRAPGSAPVIGSGCGSAGGGPKEMDNGGSPPPGYAQGADGLTQPETASKAHWRRGSVQEVGWAMLANHGGGYQWRLCKNDGNSTVSEECFQRTPLKFASNVSRIRYGSLWQYKTYKKFPGPFGRIEIPDLEVPLVKVSEGTTPPGSEWARNPFPACNLCNQADCMAKSAWLDQQACSQTCSGLGLLACPPGHEQFEPPLPGFSGYDPTGTDGSSSLDGFPWTIIDRVVVPEDIPAGRYLLSWRWDCEQSRQIWQNCADVVIE